MKKIQRIILLLSASLFSYCINAQTVNWANLNQKQKNIINLNAGIDYSISYGAGYGYLLKTKLPVLLNAEFSVPAGNNLIDDYKSKLGAQINLYKTDNVFFAAKLQGEIRRYKNDLATLLNFGSDISGTTGYYKKHWFIAAEAGFDKAIVTHFKSSDAGKANFPGIQNGWYQPSTGGNFYYGINAGLSWQKFDVYAKAGKTITQNFSNVPFIPFFAQIGLNIKFGH